MSQWKVIVTPEFQDEVREIHSYIQNTLLVPETAQKQIHRIIDSVKTLNTMPERNPLCEREPWQGRGLRKLIVDKFIVFYLPNPISEEVVVLHVFYGGRNIEDLLR